MHDAICCSCRKPEMNPVLVFGRTYCAPCSEAPGVDLAGEWVRTQQGKRNLWAWFFGGFGLAAAIATAFALLVLLDGRDSRFELITFFACMLTGLGFWAGNDQARLGLPFAAMPLVVCAWSRSSEPMMLLAALTVLFATFAATSHRSRLFTGAPMTRYRIEATYAAFNPRPIAAPTVCI